jgi:hypothetical protein
VKPQFFALLAGVAGLLLTALGALAAPQEAAFSYLFAFAFWLSVGIGALILLQALHAARARWAVVFRRPIEVMGASAPVLLLTFIPVLAAAASLYPWVHPPASLTAHQRELYAHKAPWLRLPFFCVRAAICFAVWSLAGVLLYRWSAAQDALAARSPRSISLTSRQRKLAAALLPAVVICLSFASQDWLMSLEPLWYSTVYGLYFGCGAVVSALCVLVIWLGLARGEGQAGALMRPEHFNRLGTLTLTFVCLWAYCGFSQYLLMWIATLPDEVTWYLARVKGSWSPIAVLLAAGHFGLPFLLLLQRRIKQRPRALAAVCGWVLLMHLVDVYWLVVPALHPAVLSLHWTAPFALIGVGGVCIAATLWLKGRARAVPIGDPFLPHSLEVPNA